MFSGRQSLRIWTRFSFAGALMIVGTGILTWWLLARTSTDDGAGIATVLALPVALLSLIAGLVSATAAVRSVPRPDDFAELVAAARKLLRSVATAEAVTLARLLGDSGRARPANVRFSQHRTSSLRWRVDGGAAQGTLDNVADFYGTLELGRLVVLGHAGAGKTVLALRLLLELASIAEAVLESDRPKRVMVPVRLSLASFPSSAGPSPASDYRAAIDRWIVGQLERIYGIQPPLGTVLVDGGWILPILDGLDEMDPSEDETRRAAEILIGLNHPVGPSPGRAIITCREERYRQLMTSEVSGSAEEAREIALQDATAVVVQPLDSEEIVDWLKHRFPEPSEVSGVQRRWLRVVSTIGKHPKGRLANCLSSPLNLFLACAVYADLDTEPRQLCSLDQPELETHLLNHLVPALTRNHPRVDGRHYRPDEMTRWLTALVRHMNIMGRLGFSGVDYNFYQCWRTAHPGSGRYIRWMAALLGSFYATALVALCVWLVGQVSNYWPSGDPGSVKGSDDELGLYIVLALLMCGVFAILAVPRVERPPLWRIRSSLFDTRGSRRAFLLRIGRGMLAGAAMGIPLSVTAVVVAWIDGIYEGSIWVPLLTIVLIAGIFGLFLGLPAGIIAALMGDSHSMNDSMARPSEPFWRSLTGDIVSGSMLGTALGSISGFAFGASRGLLPGILVGLIIGCTVFLIMGVLGGSGTHPWLPRYLLATAALRRRGDAPSQFHQWLDWAHGAGLLRLSGGATQFRHRGLQEHFGSESNLK